MRVETELGNKGCEYICLFIPAFAGACFSHFLRLFYKMKFKIYLEYAGYNYSGWQKQPGQSAVKTVQGSLIKAIDKVFSLSKGSSKFIELQGAGRTDAGVHAIEQVAHLECETMLAPEIMKMKINDELSSDINILEIEKAPKNFHARHDAVSRQYLYVISKRRTAFEKRYVWWIKDKLNVDKMKETSKLFIGMHDFKSFAEKSPDEKSTKCKIELLEITEVVSNISSPQEQGVMTPCFYGCGEKIFIRIKSSHFLWKMVRRIVGTLVEVGRGNIVKMTISDLLLPSPVRRGAGLPAGASAKAGGEVSKYTAPPSGLFLEKVYY